MQVVTEGDRRKELGTLLRQIASIRFRRIPSATGPRRGGASPR